MTDRDPRVDPIPGDVVCPIGEAVHHGADITYHPLTVQARTGFLVAFTEDGAPKKVVWLRLAEWCEVFSPITEWRVVKIADEAGKKALEDKHGT